MTRKPEKKPAISELDEPDTLEDKIRARAYELYEERGKEDGHDLDDWLKAEAEYAVSKYRRTAA